MPKVLNRTYTHDNFHNNAEVNSGNPQKKETSSKEGHRESTVDSVTERMAHFVQDNDEVSEREVINRGVKSLPQNDASDYEETHIRGNNSGTSFTAHQHTGKIPGSRNRHVNSTDLYQVTENQNRVTETSRTAKNDDEEDNNGDEEELELSCVAGQLRPERLGKVLNNRGEGISGREEQKETSSKEGHRESTVDSASERNAHFVQNNDQVSTREVINRGVKSLPQNKASGYEETHIRGNNSDASFIAHEHTGRIPDSRNRHVQGIDLNQSSVESDGRNSQNGQNDDDEEEEEDGDDEDLDLSCGIGQLRSERLGKVLANLYVFVVCFGLSNFFTSMVGQVIQMQLTSLERQFNIDNTRASLLDTASRVGFMSTVIFAGHFAKKSHIPLVVGVSGVIQGLMLTTPAILQFIDPYELPSTPPPKGGNSSNSSDKGDNRMYLCVSFNGTNGTDIVTNSTGEVKQAAFVLLLVVQAVKGVTDTFHSGFLPTLYMDDNMLDKTKMGTFLGILQVIVELSGPIGKQINGILTTVPVDLRESDITPTNERFVAAWWLAFLIFGAGTIVFSVPIMLFPRRLVSPRQRRLALEKAAATFSGQSSEATSHSRSNVLHPVLDASLDEESVTVEQEPLIPEPETSKDETFKAMLRDYPKALLRVLRKPVFVLMLVNIVVVTIPVSGISVFRSTYIANEFNVPMSQVAQVTAITSVTGHIAGTLISSWISRKVTTRMGYIWIISTSYVVTLAITPLYFIFGCGNEFVYGAEGQYGRQVNLTGCDCNSSTQLLSCGNDGNNYLSPCYAGCSDVDGQLFTECSALNTSSGGTVTAGLCPTDCHRNFIIYCALQGLQTFFSALEMIPSRLLILRIVEPEDRGFATSFFMFVSVFVAIPAPNLFGNVIDEMCLIWDGHFCALYDRDKIRYLISGVDLAVRGCVQVTCLLMVCIFKWDEHKEKKRSSNQPTNTYGQRVKDTRR